MKRFSPGLRTAKTAVAIVLSMFIVEYYGASSSRLLFAMLGAMAAVQPTFRDSVDSCISQMLGVLLGGLAGVALARLPISPHAAASAGVVLVITCYNGFRIRFSPSLPCFIVVLLCTTPGISPLAYALGRFWDSTIGLCMGMAVNMLVFPYDNSRSIRASAHSLERQLILFLEDLFDGDDHLPNAEKSTATVAHMERQLKIFSRQKLLWHPRRHKAQLRHFSLSEDTARRLVTHMEVLCRIVPPGHLSEENRRRLRACGANICDVPPPQSVTERDVVTNYHVREILKLRRALLSYLGEQEP